MNKEQFVYILTDLNVSISIDFNKFDMETIKDIIMNLDESSTLTIRVPYSIEYNVIKEMLGMQELTKKKKERIKIDFVD